MEYLINAFGSDIKIYFLSPIKMCGIKHTVLWNMSHRSGMWYHRFSLCVENSKKVSDYPRLLNAKKTAQNQRYRWALNPTYNNFLMKRTFLKILKKFDIDKDDLHEILSDLKAYEADVYHYEFQKINKNLPQQCVGGKV